MMRGGAGFHLGCVSTWGSHAITTLTNLFATPGAVARLHQGGRAQKWRMGGDALQASGNSSGKQIALP